MIESTYVFKQDKGTIRGGSLLFPSFRLIISTKKMPKLLQSIVTVIEVFYQYATQDEECDMLNRAELKEFLENEFHQIMKVRTPYQD